MNGPGQFRRRFGAAMLAGVAAVVLAACGSDDPLENAITVTTGTDSTGTDSTETDSTETDSTETDSTATASTETTRTEPTSTKPVTTDGASSGEVVGPVSTVSADLPSEFVGQIGAVDISGDALLPFEGDTATDPAIGSAAPVLVGTDFNGNAVRVDAATDGPTMLVFLAHYCPHCNAEVPVLNELRDSGSFPDDLNVIAVSTAVSPDRPNFPPSEWIQDVGWTFPVIADGVDMDAGAFLATAAYGVDAFPFITLIDADGNVAARWHGESTGEETIDRISTYLGM